jgi:hypothetical protein
MKQNFLLISDKFKADEIYILYTFYPLSKKWLEHNSEPRPQT